MSDHVLGDGGLRDVDAELEQLAVHAGCSPERVGEAYLPDESTDVFGNGGPTAPVSAGLPGPEESETPSGPANDGVRLDDYERVPPA